MYYLYVYSENDLYVFPLFIYEVPYLIPEYEIDAELNHFFNN